MLDRTVVSKPLNELARLCFGLGRRVEALADKLNPPSAPPVTYPRNARFKDLHPGRRAFVIGNGPSLATQDISPLKGELLFTMNSFDRHPLCRELLPVYHCFADPELNDNSPEREEYLARVAEGIGESTVFVRAWPSMKSATFERWRSAGQLYPVPIVGDLALEPITALDMCLGLPGVWSVAQLALMTAIYMGCDPIYLIGLDSDWAASLDRDRHFYGDRELDESWNWAYEGILEETLSMFRAYRHLWDFCKERDVEVYNCTAGGLLDVFPRKCFEDVIGVGRPR